MDVRTALLQLQEVIGKHNASFRVRFPPSDPIYKAYERSFFGVFNDIPIQIHAFSHAAEEIACICSDPLPFHPFDLYSEGITAILDASRSWAGEPVRTPKGVLKFKKSLSHIERHLAQEIGQRARIFFDTVYTLPRINRATLAGEEKAFWARYRKLMAAQARAKPDRDVLVDIAIALSGSLPMPLCKNIAHFLL